MHSQLLRVLSIEKKSKIMLGGLYLLFFLIMMPALARGLQGVYIGIHFKEWPKVNIMVPVYYSQILIIGMLLIGAWKYGKLKHPATYLAISVNLFILLLEPIGKSENVQLFLKSIIKG